MPEKARIKLPETIAKDDVIEVKALISHVMETGNRHNADGTPIPRNIIHTLKATFEGNLVFSADLGPGISANPYIAFPLKVTGPGTLEILWIDDQSNATIERAEIRLS